MPRPRPRPPEIIHGVPLLPLPRPRPAPPRSGGSATPGGTLADIPPSACRARITADLATIEPLPPLRGAGECGGEDVVLLKAVMTGETGPVAIVPPATPRCPMAEALIGWIRDDVMTATARLGSPLRAVANYASYECRPRNRIEGAKLSQHGLANAIDVRALVLADGTTLAPTDATADRGLREQLRLTACARFATVLGPGSDGYHEEHIHLDLAERAHATHLCQWEVR